MLDSFARIVKRFIYVFPLVIEVSVLKHVYTILWIALLDGDSEYISMLNVLSHFYFIIIFWFIHFYFEFVLFALCCFWSRLIPKLMLFSWFSYYLDIYIIYTFSVHSNAWTFVSIMWLIGAI